MSGRLNALSAMERQDQLALAICSRIREHSQFWPGVSALARRNFETFERMNPSQKWFVSDLGRTALSFAAGALHAQPRGLTLSALYRFARLNDVCSAGRVLMFYSTAVAKRCFVPEAGSARRAGERTHLSATFLDILGAYVRNVLQTLRRLEIVDGRTIDWAEDPANLRDLMASLSLAASLFREPLVVADSPLGQLLSLQGGAQVLDVLLSEASGDTRILPLPARSRQQLATRCAVSRTQVSRILQSAEERGHLHIGQETVCLSKELHDDLARQYSQALTIMALALRMCGAPMGSL